MPLTKEQQKEYQAAGGAKGSGMSAAEFQKWFNDVKAKTGLSPVAYAKQQGLGYGGMLEKPGQVTPGVQGTVVMAGAGANVLKPGSDPGQFYNASTLSEQGQLNLINEKAGTMYGSLGEAKRALGPGAQMAGAVQYVLNQLGKNSVVEANPYLQNASMVGLYDPSAFQLFMGALVNSLDPQKMLADRAALVPDWMPAVQNAVMALGNPALDVSLLADPAIMQPEIKGGKVTSAGLPSPSEPLFGPEGRPPSLPGALGLQTGEASFARSLSPEELLRFIGPLDWAYYHRPAGAPVPAGYEAGLSFGNPQQMIDPTGPDWKGNVNTCLLYTSPSPRDGATSRMPSSA